MTESIPQAIQAELPLFSGRAWLPEKILTWYQQKGPRLLLLTGEMGTGKSLAAAWLAGLGGDAPPGIAGEQHAELRSQVLGVHFCQAGGGSMAPKSMSIYFNERLSEKISGFDQAFTDSLPELVRIDARLQVESLGAGASAKVVNISNLSLGEYGDQKSFLILLHDPLKRLYQDGYNQPLLLVVDGLDEAALYTERYTILDLMKQLDELPQEVRFLATIRSNSTYIGDFPGAARIDLVDDSPNVRQEVWDFVHFRLAGLPKAIGAELVEKVTDAADGMFLYAALECFDLLYRHQQGEQLSGITLPVGLPGIYRQELRRWIARTEQEWERNGAVLGLIGVGQGRGLNRTVLEEVLGGNVLPRLNACRPYLDGTLTEGPFRLFHKSLSEYLMEDQKNVDFHVDAWRMHKTLADYYWDLEHGESPWAIWDPYGLAFAAKHLRFASESPLLSESRQQTARLVALLANSGYRKFFLQHVQAYRESVQAFRELEQQVESALQAAIAQKGQGGAALVVQAALTKHRFHQGHSLPVEIFDQAQAGNLGEAMRMLAALELDSKWAKLSALEAAWLAAAAGADQAASTVMQEAQGIAVNTWPLDLLAGRAEAVWTHNEPGWQPLPHSPDRDTVQAMLKRLGGGEVEEGRISEYLNSATGLVSEQLLAGTEMLDPDSASGYMAFEDGPSLVAYAHDNEEEGKRIFENYVRIHGANQYLHYRNLSLWLLTDPVLRHPDPKWARWGLRTILEQALKPVDLSHEQEDIDLAALALQARLQATGAQEEFDNRRRWALQVASELSEERYHSDQYGRFKQRLCALAEAASLLPPLPALKVKGDGDPCQQAGDDGVDELIRRAVCMAGGFAGFLYQAWLRLSDTVRICRRQAVFSLQDCLEQAMLSARNIHDQSFAVRAVAEVNAMRELFRELPAGEKLQVLVRRFAADPLAPEFTPRLLVGDEYKGRNTGGAKVNVLYGIRHPINLRHLAQELDLPEESLERLNRPEIAGLSANLKDGDWVRLPADDFAPRLAERFSAEALSSDLAPVQKQELIQMLVPVAARRGSSLDITLARLLLAAQVSDEKSLTALRLAIVKKPGV